MFLEWKPMFLMIPRLSTYLTCPPVVLMDTLRQHSPYYYYYNYYFFKKKN